MPGCQRCTGIVIVIFIVIDCLFIALKQAMVENVLQKGNIDNVNDININRQKQMILT